MLEVVDSLLSSGQLANTAVSNLIMRTVSQPMTVAECEKVFQKLTAWILTSELQFLRDKALEGFSSLAETSPSVFLETVDTNYVKNIFNNMRQTKPDSLVRLLLIIFSKLGKTKTYHNLDDISSVVRSHLITYISYHGNNPLLLQFLDTLYTRFPHLLPASAHDVTLLTNIVFHLHTLHVSNCKCEAKLSNLLCLIWQSIEDKTSCSLTLHSVFQILTSPSYSSPPACLLAILESLPLTSNLLCSILSFLLDQPTEKLLLMMSRILDWLEVREAPVLTPILLQFLPSLGAARGAMMSALSRTCLPKIIEQATRVASANIREQLTFLALHLLYGEQHSPAALLSVVNTLSEVFTLLSVEESWVARDFLVEAVQYFGSLYPEVVKSSRRLKYLLRDERLTPERKLKLASFAWAYPGNIKMDRIPGKMVGLVNLGNTCYLNSILQALLSTKMFTDLVAADIISYCQPVLTSLRRVFRCLKLSRRSFANPKQFLESSRPSWFHVGQQQDCSEFLTFLFQRLEEEYSILMDKANNNIDMQREKFVMENGDGGISDNSNHGHKVPMVEEQSPTLVQSVFGGTQLVVYQCLECTTKSEVLTRFTVLDLPLSTSAEEPRSSIDVEDLIKDYLKPEVLDGENQYQCDRCHGLRDAVKTTCMKMLPRHLIITLLRFKFEISSKKKEKLLTTVKIPSSLCLSGSREELVIYSLYCVIVHCGLSCEGGHYYTLVRDTHNDVWTRVSDQVVETLPGWWEEELNSTRDTPYMLFYQKEGVSLNL